MQRLTFMQDIACFEGTCAGKRPTGPALSLITHGCRLAKLPPIKRRHAGAIHWISENPCEKRMFLIKSHTCIALTSAHSHSEPMFFPSDFHDVVGYAQTRGGQSIGDGS